MPGSMVIASMFQICAEFRFGKMLVSWVWALFAALLKAKAGVETGPPTSRAADEAARTSR
jgi:hypothetical protein